MALHDLKCESCNYEWEELVSKELPPCLSCGASTIIIVFNKGVTVSGAGLERIKNRASNPQSQPTSVYIRRKD